MQIYIKEVLSIYSIKSKNDKGGNDIISSNFNLKKKNLNAF